MTEGVGGEDERGRGSLRRELQETAGTRLRTGAINPAPSRTVVVTGRTAVRHSVVVDAVGRGKWRKGSREARYDTTAALIREYTMSCCCCGTSARSRLWMGAGKVTRAR